MYNYRAVHLTQDPCNGIYVALYMNSHKHLGVMASFQISIVLYSIITAPGTCMTLFQLTNRYFSYSSMKTYGYSLEAPEREIRKTIMRVPSYLEHYEALLYVRPLTLCTLGKNFSRRHFGIFFLFFPRKQDLTLHANCLHRRQFA